MQKACLAVLLLLSACVRPAAAGTLPSLSGPAVAQLIIADPEEGEVGYCTVWKVGKGLLATAGHCCDKKYTYTAVGPHAYPGQALTVVQDDDVHDVCILKGDMKGEAIALAARDPEIGEAVWTAGYPTGTFLISSGFWSGRDEDGQGVCSVVVAGGASGSPVMDAAGRAVGVLIARRIGMDNMTFVSTIEHLRNAILAARRQ